MKYVIIPPPVYQPAPQPIEIDITFAVYVGKGQWILIDDQYQGFGGHTKQLYTSWRAVKDTNKFILPMDALCAIGAGYITAEELYYPETLVAAISLCNS